MKEASPHKESTKGVCWDKRGLEVGIKWATEDAVGQMAVGWEGRHSGRSQVMSDLGQDQVGLVPGTINDLVELEYGAHVGHGDSGDRGLNSLQASCHHSRAYAPGRPLGAVTGSF